MCQPQETGLGIKVTHIYHSGFLIETSNNAYLFDYYKGEVPKEAWEKKLYVFFSHVHQDHFSFNIFKDFKEHTNCTYLLSRDIKRSFNQKFFLKMGVMPQQLERLTFIGFHEEYEDEVIKVFTLKSNDAGVAFLVREKESGHTFFHAGDLNLWLSEDMDENDEEQIKKIFYGEVELLKEETVDVAMIVVDPLLEKQEMAGLIYFLDHVNTRMVCPMHYLERRDVLSRIEHEIDWTRYPETALLT